VASYKGTVSSAATTFAPHLTVARSAGLHRQKGKLFQTEPLPTHFLVDITPAIPENTQRKATMVRNGGCLRDSGTVHRSGPQWLFFVCAF
jgi:hypothetical protein